MPELVNSADAHFTSTFSRALSPEKRISPTRLRLNESNECEGRYRDDLASIETLINESRLPTVCFQAWAMYSQLFLALVAREASEWSVFSSNVRQFYNHCTIGAALECVVDHESWSRSCIEHAFCQNSELLAWFAECLFSMLKLWREWLFTHQRISLFASLQTQFYSICQQLEVDFISCTSPQACQHLQWTRCVRSHSELLQLVPTNASCHFSNCVLLTFLHNCREQLVLIDEMDDSICQTLWDDEETAFRRLEPYGAYLNRSSLSDCRDNRIILSQATFGKIMFHNKRESIERDWFIRRVIHPFQQESLIELHELKRRDQVNQWFHFVIHVALSDSEHIHRKALESSFPGPLLPLVEQIASSSWSQLFVSCHSVAYLHRMESLRRRETLMLATRVWQSICETFRSTLRTLCGAQSVQQQSLQQDLITADMQGRVDYFLIAETKARSAVGNIETMERGTFDMSCAQLLHRAIIETSLLYRSEVVGRQLLYRVIAVESNKRKSIHREEAHMRSLFEASLRPVSCFGLKAGKLRLAPQPPHCDRTAAPSSRPSATPRSPKRVPATQHKRVLVDENSIFSLVASLSTFLTADEALTIIA